MFWYHQELERLEKKIKEINYKPSFVFYGSSTFTLWKELETVFKKQNAINLGFGGSTLAACTWFFDRVFKTIEKPDAIILYAGDNDLGDGRHPEEVVLFLENLLRKIASKYGAIPCFYISIKPSVSRWNLAGSIRYANSNIKQLETKSTHFYYINIYDEMLNKEGYPDAKYFADDGLHLSKEGYVLWEKKLKNSLLKKE